MNQWDERIVNHTIWEDLKNVGHSIDSALLVSEIDPDSISGIERIRLAIAAIGKRLAATDPLLLTPSQLNSIDQPIITVFSELSAFGTDHNPARIINANLFIDTAIAQLGLIPGAISQEDLSILSSSASSYRGTVTRYLKDATKAQKEFEDSLNTNLIKVSELGSAIVAEQNKLSSIISDYQSQFSTSQDKRASEFASMLSDIQSKIATEQVSQKDSFAENQRSFQDSFAELASSYEIQIKEQNSAFQNIIKEVENAHQSKLQELQTTYANKASIILESINDHKKKVEKLVGVIGNLGVTSGYLKVANYARYMTLLWQAITIISLAGLVYVAYEVAFPNLQNTIVVDFKNQDAGLNLKTENSETKKSVSDDRTYLQTEVTHKSSNSNFDFLQGFLTRLFLSVTFGIFAAYSARQASRFFDMELKNRQRALELEALGPFIEPLEKADQDKFRLQIGERSFAVPGNERDPKTDSKSDDTESTLSLLKPKEWGEAISEIIKASK